MNNSNDFEAIFPEENEEKALTDRYFELYELLGAEAMMKLYDHCHGDKIDCPMKLYRAEYVADLAEQEKDRRKRAEIVRAGGYALKFIESLIQKRKKESEKQFTKCGICVILSLITNKERCNMPFIMIRNDITKVEADAVVNAANTSLLGGGGVDGAIHKAAGPRLLLECISLHGCKVGEAKATKGYNMPCKYIIHTVGPIWRGGGKEKEEQLYSCYKNSLNLAEINGCKSIAFPLISAGAYGCPKEKAISIAQKAIRDYLRNHDMDVYLVLFDKSAVNVSQKLKLDIQSYIDDKYSEEHYPSEVEKQRARLNAPSTRPYEPEKDEHKFFCITICKEELLKHIEKPDFSFSDKLFQLIDERGMTDPEVYMRANVSKQVFSKIRRSGYHPKKNTILALAVALKLSLEETNDLLSYAGYTLSRCDKGDLIVSYYIEHKIFDVDEINVMLLEFDQTLLGSAPVPEDK